MRELGAAKEQIGELVRELGWAWGPEKGHLPSDEGPFLGLWVDYGDVHTLGVARLSPLPAFEGARSEQLLKPRFIRGEPMPLPGTPS